MHELGALARRADDSDVSVLPESGRAQVSSEPMDLYLLPAEQRFNQGRRCRERRRAVYPARGDDRGGSGASRPLSQIIWFRADRSSIAVALQKRATSFSSSVSLQH